MVQMRITRDALSTAVDVLEFSGEREIRALGDVIGVFVEDAHARV